MDALFVMALVVSASAIYFVMRGIDVRLVLFSAALVLASMAGKVLGIFDVFFSAMGDGQVIGPICSAMGFSFVLRQTGCDREMVRLLLNPLRRFRWLLVPGGAIVGFVTNMAITSQTASAAAVGPILIPLMLAAGFHPLSAAATLVLGCSAGGNLFNPGEPDIVNVQINTHTSVSQVIATVALPEIAAFASALLLFSLLRLREKRESVFDTDETESQKPIDLTRALLPPLPILILFLLMPALHFFPLVAEWYPKGFPVVHAMLISTIVCVVVVRKDVSNIAKQFFEGLGYGYVQVISLIITASCFIESLKMCGLIDTLVRGIASGGVLASLSTTVSTLGLAFVCGSGTAPSIAFSKAVLPGLLQQGMELQKVIDLGVLGAIGATFGRTMSPVAAIVIFASTLTNTKTTDIVKLLALPLLVGICVAVLISLLQ